MGSNISSKLQTVNLQDNALTSVELSGFYNMNIMWENLNYISSVLNNNWWVFPQRLIFVLFSLLGGDCRLVGNPVCRNIQLANTSLCHLEHEPYRLPQINQSNCKTQECPQDYSYSCLHPYEGEMIFRAPYFQDVTNHSLFEKLSLSVWNNFSSHLGSMSLQNRSFDGDQYLIVELKLCPPNDGYFNRTEILEYLDLSIRRYKAPPIFGPYYFIAYEYDFPGDSSVYI